MGSRLNGWPIALHMGACGVTAPRLVSLCKEMLQWSVLFYLIGVEAQNLGLWWAMLASDRDFLLWILGLESLFD